jgi:hypothetical protein
MRVLTVSRGLVMIACREEKTMGKVNKQLKRRKEEKTEEDFLPRSILIKSLLQSNLKGEERRHKR